MGYVHFQISSDEGLTIRTLESLFDSNPKNAHFSDKVNALAQHSRGQRRDDSISFASTPGLSGGLVYTDEDGHYEIVGLSRDNTYEIIAYGDDCSDAMNVVVPPSKSRCIALDDMVLKFGAMASDTNFGSTMPDTDSYNTEDAG